VVGGGYSPSAKASSGLPVTFTLDGTSTGCSLSGGVVSFTGVGTCVVNANQAGDATYAPAPQEQRSSVVNDAPSFVQASPPLTASKGTPYGYTFQASGTPAPTYSLSGGPSWLSIDSTTGVVSGTPPNGTTFTYSVVATSSAGSATAGPFTVAVTSPPPASTRADVSVSLSCPRSAKVGVTTSCKVTVKNSGPATAKNVWVALALPYSLRLVSTSSGQSWWHNVVTWKTSSLSSRASKTFTVTFKPLFSGRSTLIAGTASSNPDPKWSNNATAKSITINRR
jgi:uncharacterized repeat protein (TIGR01451 family)